ncbi:MAG: S-layer homology domain-containing protein [Oscillospiraceae bacterium]|nr:S-layer homology domain-containing protein [Oscillospiraceae bacterium]
MLKRQKTNRILATILTIALCLSMSLSVNASIAPPVEGNRDYSPSTVGMFDQGYWNLILAPGADETKMNFSWHSSRSVTTVGIGFQKRDDASTYQFIAGTTRNNVSTDAGDAEHRNTRTYQVNNVTISGLEPGTTYDYVLIQDSAVSDFFSFTTVNPNRFSFYAMSDIQIGVDSSNIPYGQVRTNVNGLGDQFRNHEFHTENWKAALSIARRISPHAAFIMSAGDQVEAVGTQNGTFSVYQGEYDLFASANQLSSLPIVSSIGNHDFHPMFLDHFNFPQNSENFNQFGTGNGVEFDYWFRHGNTFFLVMSVNAHSDADYTMSATRRAKIVEWASQNDDATWKIAMFYYPPYSVYRAESDAAKAAVRNAFNPLLEEIGIDLVINGHCHSYNRTHHINGGTGEAIGEPLKTQYWVDPTDGSVHYGEFGDDNANQGAGNSAGTAPEAGGFNPNWNVTGTKGYTTVLNPTGIVYFTLSTPSGSKFYATNAGPEAREGGGNPRIHSANFQHQTELPHISVIDITENTLTFTTYQIEGRAGNSLIQAFPGDSLPGGTSQRVNNATTPANGSRINSSNDVSLVDSYTIIKTDTPSENVTAAEILAYLAQEVDLTNVADAVDSANDVVTRAMFIAELYNLEGSPSARGAERFSDVSVGDWYYSAVQWAASNGIVAGVGDNRFIPTRPITRQEIAIVLNNYATFKNHSLVESRPAPTFADSSQIKAWAMAPVLKLYQAGLFTVENNRFMPYGTSTRSEVLQLLDDYRSLIAGR